MMEIKSGFGVLHHFECRLSQTTVQMRLGCKSTNISESTYIFQGRSALQFHHGKEQKNASFFIGNSSSGRLNSPQSTDRHIL